MRQLDLYRLQHSLAGLREELARELLVVVGIIEPVEEQVQGAVTVICMHTSVGSPARSTVRAGNTINTRHILERQEERERSEAQSDGMHGGMGGGLRWGEGADSGLVL